MAIVVPTAIVLFLVGCFLFKRKTTKKYDTIQEQNGTMHEDIVFSIIQLHILVFHKLIITDAFLFEPNTTVKTSQFDLATIETATNQFSVDNRLGEGGFGEVYKVSII